VHLIKYLRGVRQRMAEKSESFAVGSEGAVDTVRVRVRVRVRARTRARARVRVRVCVRLCLCTCACVCA